MSAADLVMTAAELKSDMQLAELFPDLGYSRRLYDAALAQDIDLAFMRRDAPMPRAWQTRRNLPLVVVVSDTVGTPTGPTSWRSTVDLISWAEVAILHRAGAPVGHYAHAAELAKTHLRVLLIETPAETFDAWLALLQNRPRLAVEVMR